MKVSVIIPTYNRPGYLAQAVHSVLQQTQPVFEIIIVDDGSLPIHHPKIAALKQLDDCISVFNFPKNKGASAARDYGLEKSDGDYIIFLDDDDLLHPDMVESNLKIFNADSNIDVVSSGYGFFIDTTPPDRDWSKEHQNATFPKIIFSWNYADISMLTEQPFSALLRKSLQVSASLISRQAIGPARFPEDLTRGEDNFFWLTLARADCSFRINHAQLCFHRIHRYNSSSAPNWRKASLKYRLKLFHEGMATDLKDRLVVHWGLARELLQFDRQQSLKHLFYVCRILVSFEMIPSWPMLLKYVPDKIYEKWRFRKLDKARKSIMVSSRYGNSC